MKYTHNKKELLDCYEHGRFHYFGGSAILKHKYFLIAIDGNILVFDIDSGKLLKRYILSRFRNIIKWNNNDDNEFLMDWKGNILLFELTNDLQLKIIGQSFFKDIINLKKLSENTNKFYDDGRIESRLRNPYDCSRNKRKNNECTLTIYS